MIRRFCLIAALIFAVLPALADGHKPKYQEGLFLTSSAAYYAGPVGRLGVGWTFGNGYTLGGAYEYGELNAVHGTVPFRCYTVPYTVDDRRQSGFGLTFTVPLYKAK